MTISLLKNIVPFVGLAAGDRDCFAPQYPLKTSILQIATRFHLFLAKYIVRQRQGPDSLVKTFFVLLVSL